MADYRTQLIELWETFLMQLDAVEAGVDRVPGAGTVPAMLMAQLLPPGARTRMKALRRERLQAPMTVARVPRRIDQIQARRSTMNEMVQETISSTYILVDSIIEQACYLLRTL